MSSPAVVARDCHFVVLVNGRDYSGGFTTFSTQEIASEYAAAVRDGGDFELLRREFWQREDRMLGNSDKFVLAILQGDTLTPEENAALEFCDE
jgi:hypothetical protein